MPEAFVDPQPASEQQKHSGENSGDEQRARERSDLRDQLALVPGHMFFRRVKENLIVFVTGQNTAPNKQNNEYGGDDPPGDQKVQNGAVWRGFHGDLP